MNTPPEQCCATCEHYLPDNKGTSGYCVWQPPIALSKAYDKRRVYLQLTGCPTWSGKLSVDNPPFDSPEVG